MRFFVRFVRHYDDARLFLIPKEGESESDAIKDQLKRELESHRRLRGRIKPSVLRNIDAQTFSVTCAIYFDGKKEQLQEALSSFVGKTIPGTFDIV